MKRQVNKFINKTFTKAILLDVFIVLIVSTVLIVAGILLNGKKDNKLPDTNIIFNSNQVNYDNTNTGLSSRNVQTAIDELYSSVTNGCYVGYTKGTETGGTYTCNKRNSDSAGVTVFESSDVSYDNSNGISSSNVEGAINELKSIIPYCKDSYNKTNEVSNSYNCKKTITITANNQTITYGGSISTGTNQVTVTGLVTGSSLTGITLTQSTTNVPGGTITASNATIESNNTDVTSSYNINYATGTLTINKANGYVNLSANSGNVNCNGTATFTVSSHHQGTLSCTSSNDTKVTCSVSGTTITISGVAEGSATITVTSGATANYNEASATYTATTGACASWHYDNNYINASFCQNDCLSRCRSNYRTAVWSCVARSTVAPSGPSLATGKYCWCKY